MPDGYTHVVTGQNALSKNNDTPFSRLAFGSGTNGPDPLFFYKIWNKNRKFDLKALGSKMHKEKSGEFLITLVKNAKTPVTQSYTMGFLTHYATDKTVHPYVAFLTDSKNAPYSMAHGHGFYECTLDSDLYEKKCNTRIVSAQAATPTPIKSELIEIAALLKTSILQVFRQDIPLKEYLCAFHDILFLRKVFTSYTGFRRWLFTFVENHIFKEEGYITSNLTPGRHPIPLPLKWTNAFTGEECTSCVAELLKAAEDIGADFIKAAKDYWANRITLEQFSSIVGNQSYETGLELEG